MEIKQPERKRTHAPRHRKKWSKNNKFLFEFRFKKNENENNRSIENCNPLSRTQVQLFVVFIRRGRRAAWEIVNAHFRFEVQMKYSFFDGLSTQFLFDLFRPHWKPTRRFAFVDQRTRLLLDLFSTLNERRSAVDHPWLTINSLRFVIIPNTKDSNSSFNNRRCSQWKKKYTNRSE